MKDDCDKVKSEVISELSLHFKKNITNITFEMIGEKDGVYSFVSLVSVEFEGGDATKLIVKVPTVEKYLANRLRRNWTATGNTDSFLDRLISLHNKEIFFYQHVPVSTVTPKMVIAHPIQEDKSGILALEYISNTRCVPIDDYFNENQIYQIIGAYASLQAVASEIKETDRNILDTGLLEGVLNSTLSADNISKRLEIISKSYSALENILKRLENSFDVSVASKFFFEEKRRWNLLLHGDLHNTNIIMKDNNFVSFIDFQTVHYGNPCEDIIRLLCIGVESRSRRIIGKNLLKYYCEQLKPLGLLAINDEELVASYEKMFPLCSIWALISLHAAYDHQIHGNDRLRQHCHDSFVQKMIGIAEDIIKFCEN